MRLPGLKTLAHKSGGPKNGAAHIFGRHRRALSIFILRGSNRRTGAWPRPTPRASMQAPNLRSPRTGCVRSMSRAPSWAIRVLMLFEGAHGLAWQSLSSAPFNEDLELAFIDAGGVHALVFPCRRIQDGWVKSQGDARIEVRPTHWRRWPSLPASPIGSPRQEWVDVTRRNGNPGPAAAFRFHSPAPRKPR